MSDIVKHLRVMGYDHHTEDYFSKKERKEKVVKRMEEGDWEGVLQEFQSTDEYREPLLLWIRPTLASLYFIKEQIDYLGLAGISSVGCGCGTLEWLLQVRGHSSNMQCSDGEKGGGMHKNLSNAIPMYSQKGFLKTKKFLRIE